MVVLGFGEEFTTDERCARTFIHLTSECLPGFSWNEFSAIVLPAPHSLDQAPSRAMVSLPGIRRIENSIFAKRTLIAIKGVLKRSRPRLMESSMENYSISHGVTLDEVRLNHAKKSKAIEHDDGDRDDRSEDSTRQPADEARRDRSHDDATDEKSKDCFPIHIKAPQ